MSKISELSRLLRRVIAAREPNRALDAEICLALEFSADGAAPELTASTDAVNQLMAALLPGWTGMTVAHGWGSSACIISEQRQRDGVGETPALALLAAVLYQLRASCT